MVPKFVYKYKSLATIEDMVRLLDIIENNRIYLPLYRQLNDPLEGQVLDIDIPGYCGKSMSLAADEEDVALSDIKEQYRVLSLARSAVEPQLWTHYANAYCGVCLCFRVGESFRDIRPVNYCKKRQFAYPGDSYDYEIIENLVMDSFFMKKDAWSYEKELRIVKKIEQGDYLEFKASELCGIIIGHNTSREISSFLRKHIPKDVLVFKTKVGYRSFEIKILDFDYEYQYDGSQLNCIDLRKSLKRRKMCPVSLVNGEIL